MRILFLLLLAVHGLIHLLGVVKAFQFAPVQALTKDISKPMGLLWLSAGLLFLSTALLYFLHKDGWWYSAMIATLCSQLLIFASWQDAKFGTIANLFIQVVSILAFSSFRFEQKFRADIEKGYRDIPASTDLLTEQDIAHLPEPVQRYIRYSGFLNKPKVHSMHVRFDGQMRDRNKDWFPFVAEQYSFFHTSTRLFYMEAQMFGMTVPGYHVYRDGKAKMDVRLFGLIPVMQAEGPEMNQAETVTHLNDMCLMAPATLIDKRIKWEEIDSLSCKATFTVQGNTVQAVLYMNEQGQLKDFASEDRYVMSEKKQYRFTTPIHGYQNKHGYQILSQGDGVWHYPDGPFVYGKFNLKDITFNPPQ